MKNERGPRVPSHGAWTNDGPFVGVAAMGYFLPSHTESVAALASTGRTTSTAEHLRELGYETVHIARSTSNVEMARRAIDDLVARSGFDLGEVDLIVFGGALATSAIIEPEPDFAWTNAVNPLPLFKFPAMRLQAELGLPHAPVLGVSQLACNVFHGCLRMARALLLAEPHLENILCVAADRFPEPAHREVVFNLMSDGACAAVVSRGATEGRILGASQISRGTYWDGETRHDELVAAYFPLARSTVNEALVAAGLGIDEIDCFIPHNFSTKSWQILSRILGIDYAKVFTDNIARVGHVIAADNVINYLDALGNGRIRKGDKVALFVTGFGAHFSCTILEV